MEVLKHFASFSEAIREGAKLRPQGFGNFFLDGRTCAFGAGREVVTGPESDYADIYRLYSYLQDLRETRCPDCRREGHVSLSMTMFHLNDDHRWTREAIADWLETEEEKLGYVTVSDEGFGITQPIASASPLFEAVESLSQASESKLSVA